MLMFSVLDVSTPHPQSQHLLLVPEKAHLSVLGVPVWSLSNLFAL